MALLTAYEAGGKRHRIEFVHLFPASCKGVFVRATPMDSKLASAEVERDVKTHR